jgi:integrase
MASVKALFDQEGKVRGYRVRYRTGAGRPLSKTFPKGHKAAADAFAVKMEADKIGGTELDPRGSRLTLGEYVAEWTAVQSHRSGSAARVADALGPLVDVIGADRPLAKVRQSDIKGWLKVRQAQAGRGGKRISAGTIRTDWTWVRGLFRAALADKLRGDNPCDGVTLPKVERRRIVPPPREGVEAIASRLPASWAALGPLGARTGLRPAELLGLCAEQVDFLRRELHVDRQMIRGAVILEPKTASSRRTVPLEDSTLELLAAHLAEHPLGPAVPVVGEDGAPAGEGRLIFHRPAGGPLSHRAVDDTWRRQASAAGFAGVRVHDMRHFFASNALAAGLSVAEVAELLGHSRPSITADMYAHPLESTPARARAAVASIWQPRHERVTELPAGGSI